MNQTTQPDHMRYIRLKDVLCIFPVSKSAWYRGIQSGKYPKPKKLGARTSAWRVSDINQLIECINGAETKGLK